jgi:hypothetical protein
MQLIVINLVVTADCYKKTDEIPFDGIFCGALRRYVAVSDSSRRIQIDTESKSRIET